MEQEVLDDPKLFNEKDELVRITKDKATYLFKSMGPDELGVKVKEYLSKSKYKLESGTPVNGVYGKGSKVLRVLFGAFVKRFEWQVTIAKHEDKTGLVFTKLAKGYVGGVIGVQQVKKEYQRITETLKAFHASHNNK